MRTIDATPTWEGILPALLAVIESGATAEAAGAAQYTSYSANARVAAVSTLC